MGERLLCKHQVIGSIPIGSTISPRTWSRDTRECVNFVNFQDVGNQFAVAHVAPAIPDPRHMAVGFVFDIVNGFF